MKTLQKARKLENTTGELPLIYVVSGEETKHEESITKAASDNIRHVDIDGVRVWFDDSTTVGFCVNNGNAAKVLGITPKKLNRLRSTNTELTSADIHVSQNLVVWNFRGLSKVAKSDEVLCLNLANFWKKVQNVTSNSKPKAPEIVFLEDDVHYVTPSSKLSSADIVASLPTTDRAYSDELTKEGWLTSEYLYRWYFDSWKNSKGKLIPLNKFYEILRQVFQTTTSRREAPKIKAEFLRNGAVRLFSVAVPKKPNTQAKYRPQIRYSAKAVEVLKRRWSKLI